jgi:hypothetical protein
LAARARSSQEAEHEGRDGRRGGAEQGRGTSGEAGERGPTRGGDHGDEDVRETGRAAELVETAGRRARAGRISARRGVVGTTTVAARREEKQGLPRAAPGSWTAAVEHRREGRSGTGGRGEWVGSEVRGGSGTA